MVFVQQHCKSVVSIMWRLGLRFDVINQIQHFLFLKFSSAEQTRNELDICGIGRDVLRQTVKSIFLTDWQTEEETWLCVKARVGGSSSIMTTPTQLARPKKKTCDRDLEHFTQMSHRKCEQNYRNYPCIRHAFSLQFFVPKEGIHLCGCVLCSGHDGICTTVTHKCEMTLKTHAVWTSPT